MKLFARHISARGTAALFALLMAAGLAMGLAGCKEKEVPQPQPEPVDPNFPVELDLGEETVTIKEKPLVVVSLSPAITNTLFDMGLEDALAGVSTYCKELPKAKNLPDCGTAQNVDLKAVKALAPQVLFTDTPLLSQQLTALYQMDVEVVLISRPGTMTEIENRQLILAQALYGQEEGTQKGREYQQEYKEHWQKTEEAIARWAEDNNRLTAVLLARPDTIMATGDTFEGSMLEQLGFVNLGEDGFNWQYQPQEGETFAPEVIFYDSAIAEEEITASELYKESPAVTEGRLYPVEWQYIHLQGEDMLEEYEAMAMEYYPEAFAAQEEDESPAAPGDDDAPADDAPAGE